MCVHAVRVTKVCYLRIKWREFHQPLVDSLIIEVKVE